MSFCYDPKTGTAYSDLENFDDWSAEINLGREAWLDVNLRRLLPRAVYKSAYKTAKKSKSWVISYLRQNGYVLMDSPGDLRTDLVHNGKTMTSFKVALQPPVNGKCRICGNPVEPTRQDDQCGDCDLENRLANKFALSGLNRQDVFEGRKGMGDIT